MASKRDSCCVRTWSLSSAIRWYSCASVSIAVLLANRTSGTIAGFNQTVLRQEGLNGGLALGRAHGRLSELARVLHRLELGHEAISQGDGRMQALRRIHAVVTESVHEKVKGIGQMARCRTRLDGP